VKNITRPLPFTELNAKPPLDPQLPVSDDIQQTLSLLCGYDGEERRLIRVSPSGVLYVAPPRVNGIFNISDAEAGYNWQGSDIKATEVLIRAMTTNSGLVWANVDVAATVDTGYPLASGEWIRWSISNLKNLHLHIVTAAEKAIVVYSQ